MNMFDYYNNPEIKHAIGYELNHIRNHEDKEDCRQEIFAEIYDFMPLTEADAIKIVRRISQKFRRNIKKLGAELYESVDSVVASRDGNYMSRHMVSPWDTEEYHDSPRVALIGKEPA